MDSKNLFPLGHRVLPCNPPATAAAHTSSSSSYFQTTCIKPPLTSHSMLLLIFLAKLLNTSSPLFIFILPPQAWFKTPSSLGSPFNQFPFFAITWHLICHIPEPTNFGTYPGNNHLTHSSDVRLKYLLDSLSWRSIKKYFKNSSFKLSMIQSSMKT